jgi:hypothetical protein
MKRLVFLLLLCISYYSNSSYSQDYSFSVPRVLMDVRVLPGGGAMIHYTMNFVNTPGGHAIDIVDVGLPHEKYSIESSRAWVNGTQTTGVIQPSQYVKPGLEVHLDSLTIPPAGSGTFEFETIMPDMVFQDTTRKDLASLQITPTWFGEQYVQGTTDLTIQIRIPEGVKPEEVLSQSVLFTGKELNINSVVASWQMNRRFTSPYMVGVSFPKRVMTHIVSMSMSQLMMRWYRGAFSQTVRTGLVIASAVCLFIIFMRFTGNTGCVFFFPLLIAAGFFYVKFDAAQILIWPLLVVLAVIVETARKRRKAKYLPAIASVEGGGIKRGLTAPEAAVLLELPLNKVITLILFGMMKKGAIKQFNKEPVMFEVVDPTPADAILQKYEIDFIALMKKKGTTITVQDVDFSKPIKQLVESVAARMVGFDVTETRGYYEHIISRAWKEAEEIGDVDAWQKKMDEKVDWMMLDPNFGGRFAPYQTRYIPRSYRTTSVNPSGAIPSLGGSSAPSSSPRFSDVAGSVSGWFQNTAAGVVGSVEGGKQGGILNFASFDKAMGEAMKSSGGSGRSGGGGGCACACAGCACACACAGGGR